MASDEFLSEFFKIFPNEFVFYFTLTDSTMEQRIPVEIKI